jgi:hypothetical protein
MGKLREKSNNPGTAIKQPPADRQPVVDQPGAMDRRIVWPILLPESLEGKKS